MPNEKIFIQIASYRDPELIPTLKDCIANAKNPKNLVFGIAWQHGPEENLDEFKDDPRFRIIDIRWQDSQGACWARNQIQQRYADEDYTLQLDSHHRFVKDWDIQCIEMIKQLQGMGHAKPLITGYIPSYDPENDPAARIQAPWKMIFDRFIPEGAIFFLPATIDEWATLTAPVPARFYSAHFCFTLGQFCKEVPHDPDYYFHGEEISIAVRAFTHGYDLFHSHKILAWHEYTRKGRSKHWDDHIHKNKEEIPKYQDWGLRNAACHKKNRCLFSMDGESYDSVQWGPYGFGNVRTLRDYEKYAGINFQKRGIQQETKDYLYPPNPWQKYKTDEEWKKSFLCIFKHCIDIQLNQVPLDDYEFWVVAFEKADNTPIDRKDSDAKDVKRMLDEGRNPNGDKYIKVWREFSTEEKPHHWVVWPYSKSKGWCERITGNL